MSAFLEIASFFVNHGIWVAAGSALAIGVAMLAPLARARPTKRGFTLPASSPATATYLQAHAQPGPKADPMELLRSLSRARRSHVVMIGHASPSADITDTREDQRHEKVMSLEAFLRDYRGIPKDRPIDVILFHSRELDLSDTRRIAKLLLAHKGKVTVILPYRVMSHSCLLALAGDEIIMSPDAALVFDAWGRKHALEAGRLKRPRHMSDEALLRRHALLQEARETEWLASILLKHRRVRRWRAISRAIAAGAYDQSQPARIDNLLAWGLRARTMEAMENIELPSIRDAGVLLFSASRQETSSGISLSTLAPVCSATCPTGDVREAMLALEHRRGTRVISIIHDAGAASDSVDDQTTAEALRAIRSTPAGTGLDIILHTPGGDALGADQIVRALKAHRGRKTIFVPYEAFSAGTMVALTGDEIFLSEVASLGPIDVQFKNVSFQLKALEAVGSAQFGDSAEQEVAVSFHALVVDGLRSQHSARAYLSLLEHKRPAEISESNLALSCKARSRIHEDQLRALASMKGNYPRGRARRVARTLNDGYLSHGFPIMYEEARKIGLNVKQGIPDEVFMIVDSFLARGDGYCSVIHCPD
jgi:ClpP class serine protease